jgi:glycosyltransferase involved in cell wall biosynthesis
VTAEPQSWASGRSGRFSDPVSVSVIVPVKNGGALLDEMLGAIAAQEPDELLVVDSGSTDGSLDVARRHGARVLEIDPATYSHGPTRNLAAESATGDVLAFLTQDATPEPGWLDAIRSAFASDPAVGAIFGPHLARPDTSPMIARELADFFATLAGPDGGPRTYGDGDPTFLSNVNAAYRRECWAELRFRDLDYSEDQAFGEDIARSTRWIKRYEPAMAVLHAHDYPPSEFFKRYFDEYRGLNQTVGHREAIAPVSSARHALRKTIDDERWLREQGTPTGRRAYWAARGLVHHGGRQVAAVLGSRAAALPDSLEKRLSLEGRATRAPELGDPGNVDAPDRPVPTVHTPPTHSIYSAMAEVVREGVTPLTGDAAGRAGRAQLHVAFVIPPFRVGSGGHMTIFRLIEQLELSGHVCTLWVDDPLGWNAEGEGTLRGTITEHFRAMNAPVFKGFDEWFGADVVVATGWQTVHPVLRLPSCAARAYLVQDWEPDFYPASAERLFADDTYRHGLHGIAASPWLAEQVRAHGATCDHFDLGVDHASYGPKALSRRDDTIAFYGRRETDRRGVPLGALAAEEVVRRRPQTRVVVFGTREPWGMSVATEQAGILGAHELACLYSESTVGLCLSLTNYSLIPNEMLACGLPVVDVDHPSAVGVFGEQGPVSFAKADPIALADRLIELLDDPDERARRAALGLEFVADRTWEHAGAQVERQIRHALELAGKPA